MIFSFFCRNLADVSNDNVLNVHEFVLVMHLIRGLLKGLKAPPTLPRKLTPPKSQPLTLQPPTPQEREAYTKVFQALDVDRKGFLDGKDFSLYWGRGGGAKSNRF